MPHPLIANLQRVLQNQSEAELSTAVAAFRQEGWSSPLWVAGSKEEHPNGQVGLHFSLKELEGCERPVLFAYPDESQAQADHGDETLMCLTIGQLSLLAHENPMDLALINADDPLVLSHSEILMVRDVMLLESSQPYGGERDAHLFGTNAGAFMKAAQQYCQANSGVDTLHLAVLVPGGAPLRLCGVLNASSAAVHTQALQALYAEHAVPGHAFMLFDNLNRDDDGMTSELVKLAPFYTSQRPVGWWARLRERFSRPVLPIIELQI